jgi:hypothetical protein
MTRGKKGEVTNKKKNRLTDFRKEDPRMYLSFQTFFPSSFRPIQLWSFSDRNKLSRSLHFQARPLF